MLAPREILAIVVLIYFVPALGLALMVNRRHGFRKQLGWFSLVMLCLFRIVGSCTTIAVFSESHPSTGLIVASDVFSSFGLISLVVAMQGYINRLHSSMQRVYFHPQSNRVLHLGTTAAIVLSIVSATQLDDTNPDNNGQGTTLRRVAIFLILGVYTALVLMSVVITRHRRVQIPSTERPLLLAVNISLPLLAIRIVYPILAIFNVDTNVFSAASQRTAAVLATAFMVTLEEFVIVAVCLVAGFMLPVLAKPGYRADGVIADDRGGEKGRHFMSKLET